MILIRLVTNSRCKTASNSGFFDSLRGDIVRDSHLVALVDVPGGELSVVLLNFAIVKLVVEGLIDAGGGFYLTFNVLGSLRS